MRVNMRNRTLFILVLLVLLSGSARSAIDGESEPASKAEAFVGQDLHMAGQTVISRQLSTGEHVLVFYDSFSMTIGANQFFSDSAVVWLISRPVETVEKAARPRLKVDDKSRINYKAKVYLQGGLSVEKAKGSRMTNVSGTVIEPGRVMIVQFSISGEVFVTADKREDTDPRGLKLYADGYVGLQTVGMRPASVEARPRPIELAVWKVVSQKQPEAGTVAAEKELLFRYPIHYSGVGGVALKVEWDNKAKIGTITERFYLWQKQDEEGPASAGYIYLPEGRLLELQADSAVVFYWGQKPVSGGKQAAGGIEAIYLSGDVLMTEGQRTIRADEIYYDFVVQKALAVNAVMRSFDAGEGIPIYIRAAKLRQLAKNKFGAEHATLTTSEFYVPQISLNASKVIITDTTSLDAQQGEVSKSSYDVQMYDLRFKIYDKTVFCWPFMRSNTQRPDTPLKSVHVGHDNTWGTLVETRWYLARLLGLEEPEGTESTLALDYYSDRGVGSGIEVDYSKENYFGRFFGYIINDRGQDRLGRNISRKYLEPERDLRGRFGFRHRQFLPYNWQLTAELSYISDEHFLESFYRSEFNISKPQETLIYIKRIEDNWGLSFLGKIRINDFLDKLEELPSAEFHWTGQSFFDDKLTFYSDSQISRFRQRYALKSAGSEQFFTFMSTRNEIDMPITLGTAKVVPFVAGTMAYEDGLGFYKELDGGIGKRQDDVWFGEAGVRVSSQSYWKVFPDVKSQLWDLNQLRHIVRPYLTAVAYTQSDPVIEQRDTLSVGISQRLQTKRGIGDKRRTVDWMRLDTNVTWVNDSADTSDSGPGADRFIWNKPFIPLVGRYNRRSGNIFGPRRNYFGADYLWRLSDTTAVLSDLNFDMQSGVVQQLNVGFSRLRWPDLSYYLGSRYLRRIDNDYGEKGSNAFTFAATYMLDPRYSLVYSGQLDFDYGKTIRSDITLIRRYHRIYCGFTYSADASLDRQAIVFSIWPQGVPDLGIGPKRYMGLISNNY